MRDTGETERIGAAAMNGGSVWWAAGIEDTFVTAPHPVTGRTLDEYELTGHYDRWAADIDLMADLGVGAARYGIPWHKVQPSPSTWDWTAADGPLERLLEHGITPQVDLVHYGLPLWIEGGYLNRDYPRYVADYAARVAERYRGRIHWYTPLNEPRITAWYCGRLGWWPPYERSWSGFVRVMLAICQGIQATVRELQAVDPAIVDYHVDATDLYTTRDAALAAEVARRQSLVFLALDLVTGRVDETHPLHAWLVANGARPAELDSFRTSPVRPTIIGLNLYPIFTWKEIARDRSGRLRIRMPYAQASLIEDLARMYHARYRVPLAISETATKGSMSRRIGWLEDSVAACERLRAQGIPMTGYTWWPLYSLVAWAWRQGDAPIARHLLPMGLFDLDPANLTRHRTPVADRFAALARQPATPAGQPAAKVS